VITAKSAHGVACTSLRRLGHPARALDWVPRIIFVFFLFSSVTIPSFRWPFRVSSSRERARIRTFILSLTAWLIENPSIPSFFTGSTCDYFWIDSTFCYFSQDSSEWLFFQNAIQVQLHGGKTPIVLYWEMKLQDDLHVSNAPATASLQRFNWSGPPPGKRNFSQNTSYINNTQSLIARAVK